MRHQNLDNKINWEMLFNLPLDTKLVRKAAPRITEHNAQNQIATALHESVHILYAVKHKSIILSAAIATSNNFKNASGSTVKGSIIDLLDNWTWGAIESYLAAGLFELELDSDNNNYIAKAEEINAINTLQSYRKVNASNVSLPFFSDKSIVEGIFEKIYPHEFTKNWITVKTVAKALLYYRKKDGYFPDHLLGSLTRFVRDRLCDIEPTRDDVKDFYSTMSALSPYVKKQNAIERKQYEKWMRENDLDTILENNRIKQLKYNY